MKPVGIIYGDVGTTEFKCSLHSLIEKTEYVQTRHEQCGWILGQVDDIERQTDLSIEKAQQISSGKSIDINERMSAKISVVGYRDDRGLLRVPHTPFKAGEPVYKADDWLIKKVIGLGESERTGAYIGLLSGHNVLVYVDINSMVQKHVSIISKTGGGKSFCASILVEELMKHGVTSVIIDPHGEYSSLKDPTRESLPRKFGVRPRGYGALLMEFSPDTNINKSARPLKFTLSTLKPRELLTLTNIKSVRQYILPLKKALVTLGERGESYSLQDIIRVLSRNEDTLSSTLIEELRYLEEVDLFAEKGTKMSELVSTGKSTIINLRGIPPDIQELIVNRIATAMFQLRKLGRIPPLMLVVEEAHNFCPQVGKAASTKIFRTIASEGRKFGLGLCIITQRAAKVDKNVLSQCNTQIILKVTNPNDLKTIAASVEGLTMGMTDEIQQLPIGVAIVTGGNISMPLFVEIRPRETRHGGVSAPIIPSGGR